MAEQENLNYSRYGDRPRSSKSRKILAIFGIALLTASAAFLGLANWSPIQATEIGYRVQSEFSIEVDFELQMPKGSIAVCSFEALNNSFAQVGYLTQAFGPYEQDITSHTVGINTYELAVTGLVDECSLR